MCTFFDLSIFFSLFFFLLFCSQFATYSLVVFRTGKHLSWFFISIELVMGDSKERLDPFSTSFLTSDGASVNSSSLLDLYNMHTWVHLLNCKTLSFLIRDRIRATSSLICNFVEREWLSCYVILWQTGDSKLLTNTSIF